MLTKEIIKQKLYDQKEYIESLGVATLGLFGSYLNNTQHSESDIDFLVPFRNNRETFENFMALCDFLEQFFEGNKIDVVSVNGLSPHIGPKILKEVDYVEITA